ncbi:MAG: molybdopterin-binding protein [Rickettsiales bacterium]|nr:molybdopterin-binding protein [Pseudomonadota bacterium]MDA0966953.1 molybdopterin-binding protein [Pseudomonadota bacterium]MDG4543872.1 molybdopterin-binding protein [Rickettsiales bacterium]MDG4546018.1 molybdopterin-binding protein [Rickettsiales bacterium]MDG4548264.1 molybdopterin-binding protein [Rickettsiales bacterium]
MTNNSPTAALLIIGNEILSGRTQDKNLNYIAKGLGEVGIKFMEVRVIPDIHLTIIDTLNEMRAKFDYVFTTGGIGPTHDDITAECIAKAFGVELKVNEEYYKKIYEYYKGELNEGRIKMVTLPDGAVPIANPISTAPGFYIQNVYVMAGIPNVMQAMFDAVKGTLKHGAVVLSKEIRIYASESKIATPLSKLQDEYDNVEIGSYPFVEDNKIGVILVFRSSDEAALDECLGKMNTVLQRSKIA